MFATNNPRKSYSFIFVLTVLSAFIFIMVKSLNNGFNGFEANLYESKSLIGFVSHLRYSMGDRVFPQVLVGRDGWLDFTSEGNLDDYQNTNLSADKLESIHLQIITLNQTLKARGITLIVAVIPNKETIYSNKVPGGIKKLNDRSRLDLFLELFNEPDSPIVLDLRPPLKQARDDHQLYYKTDTHWNAYGAYVAYREILNRASQVYPDLRPYSRGDFEFVETSPEIHDLSRIMGAEFLKEPIIIIQPKFQSAAFFERIPPLSDLSLSWNESRQERKLLIYHDSFGVALNAFLQYSFSEAIYINNSAYECPSTALWIDTFTPDVVVIEIAERKLINLDNLLTNLLCEK